MRRKWRENEEMERDWLSTFPHSLSISSLFLHFLPLFPFPTSKCITFCCKMLNTALLSRMSQKSQHTRYEEIILGRTCCEEAPQFVPAWSECRSFVALKAKHATKRLRWKHQISCRGNFQDCGILAKKSHFFTLRIWGKILMFFHLFKKKSPIFVWNGAQNNFLLLNIFFFLIFIA